jgi:DNA-binding transcriptional ArsR family regulator
MPTSEAPRIPNSEINAIQADICAAVGDPNRVRIIYELAQGPLNVKSLAEAIDLSSSTTSRHLKVLRDKELVSSEREGHMVVYTLAAPELVDALGIFLNILDNQLAHRANLIKMERHYEE